MFSSQVLPNKKHLKVSFHSRKFEFKDKQAQSLVSYDPANSEMCKVYQGNVQS